MADVAITYAQALLNIAIEENDIDRYLAANDLMLHLFEEQPELYALLTSEFISKSDRLGLVDNFLTSINLPNYVNFIKVLIDRKRLSSFIPIAFEFKRLAHTVQNKVEAIVYSTTPLQEEKLQQLQLTLSKKHGKTVLLSNEIDEQLLGGIKVVIGDEVYDGSISGKLQQLQAKLHQGKAE